MHDDQEIVYVKLDQPKMYQASTISKAFYMKFGKNKKVIVEVNPRDLMCTQLVGTKI